EDRIKKMPAGAPAEPSPSTSDTRVSVTGPAARNAVPDSIAKMIEGDKLWRSGKPDEAAQAYKDSIKLNPNDWRAYERLAVVNASMSLFGESRKALEQLAKVQPNPPPTVLANRYELLREYFDKHFAALVNQYESAAADFEKKIITRESYYNVVKGLAIRLEAMAGFLDAVEAPPLKKPAHLHRSLACGLMAQAAASLLDYLETNAAKSKSNAEVFASQAKAEIQSAAKLEENKIVVEKEPAVTEASSEQPAAERSAPEQPAVPEQPVSEEPPSPEPYQ
ncbi:MAG: tetratricopeptide repeat protein, partial [Armatimonadota bacterium]